MQRHSNIWQWIIAVGLFVCLLLAMTACKCPCAVAETDTETTIQVRIHDTAIVTKPDSASVRLLLRCDSANNVLMDQIDMANGERLQMALQLQKLANGNGILQVDCNEDSLRQVIQLKDSIINSKKTQTIVRIEKQKDFVYWCGWVLIGIVIAGFIAGIVCIIIKFAK